MDRLFGLPDLPELLHCLCCVVALRPQFVRNLLQGAVVVAQQSDLSLQLPGRLVALT